MLIRLEGNLDDDPRDMIALLKRLEPIHATHREPPLTRSKRRWTLDCAKCQYLGPWATALICAAFLDGLQKGHNPRVRLPTTPPPLAAYCVFSGMAKLFEAGPPPDADHPQCETIPVEQFFEASWDRSNRIVRLLRRHTLLDADTEDQIRTCVQEVTQNIVDHAGSEIGGVMAARYMAQAQEVRVGIVDHGVGIAARLREKFPDTTSAQLALSRVVTGGFSSYSRPNNMGLGVSNLFALLESSGGRMVLMTGSDMDRQTAGQAELNPRLDSPSVRELDCHCPGTAVFFSLPVRTAAATGED